MIWDFIRDFFVQYIFGGFDSNGDEFGGLVGMFYNESINERTTGITTYTGVPIGDFIVDNDFTGVTHYITLGDWLSTTATIICMALITWFCIWLVIWLFKLVSSAFLLRK